MKIFYRDCIKDFVLEAKNGDRLELFKGVEYITSPIENEMVTVFTKYWVKVSAHLFEGEREKPKGCEQIWKESEMVVIKKDEEPK